MAERDDAAIYPIGFGCTAMIVFVGVWIYCIATYGFLLGVGLGWLPALICAFIAGLVWPLLALLLILAVSRSSI